MVPPLPESWRRSSERFAATNVRPSRSSCREERVVDPAAGIREARFEVVAFQVGHLVENLRCVETGSEQVEDITHANTHPAHARTSATLLRIEGDAVE